MSSVATNELDVEWELYMSKSGTSNVREIFKEIRGYNSELDDLLNSAINCKVISTKLFVDILSFPELYEVINNSDVDVALFALTLWNYARSRNWVQPNNYEKYEYMAILSEQGVYNNLLGELYKLLRGGSNV